jgi:hypothetical protein
MQRHLERVGRTQPLGSWHGAAMLLGSAYRAGNARKWRSLSGILCGINSSARKVSLHRASTAAAVASAPEHPSAPEYPHASVMLQEVLNGFRSCNIEAFVDCTLGAGGHAAAMLAEHQVSTSSLFPTMYGGIHLQRPPLGATHAGWL